MAIRLIFNTKDRIALTEQVVVAIRRSFGRNNSVGESHFCARGVARKREYCGNLCLPSKAPDAERPCWCLDGLDAVCSAGDAISIRIISIFEGNDGCVGNGLDHSKGQRTRRDTIAHMICNRWQVLGAGG